MSDADLAPGLFGVIGEAEPAEVEQDDLLVAVDPSARFADPAERRRAFEAWRASGGGIDELPAGLLGAIAGAALGQGRGR